MSVIIKDQSISIGEVFPIWVEKLYNKREKNWNNGKTKKKKKLKQRTTPLIKEVQFTFQHFSGLVSLTINESFIVYYTLNTVYVLLYTSIIRQTRSSIFIFIIDIQI